MSIDDPSKDLEDGKTAVSWPIGLNNSEVITVIERIYDVIFLFRSIKIW